MKKKAITIKEIDPETFRRFKAACATLDLKMRKAVINCMEKLPNTVKEKESCEKK